MRKLLHPEILKERLSLEDSQKIERHPISLMLYNIRSLYNVGSIFRTADSALLKELILTGYTPHPPRKEIEKTALGAVQSVPWRYFNNISEAIENLKKDKYKIIAVEITDKKRFYHTLTPDEFPLCLILGNELSGIDNIILNQCDDAIEIPMYGTKHSLNVSVAAGIVAFSAVKIWRDSINNLIH
jgi:tRNA G18 (ribose-2'-O)-methylase SpoU